MFSGYFGQYAHLSQNMLFWALLEKRGVVFLQLFGTKSFKNRLFRAWRVFWPFLGHFWPILGRNRQNCHRFDIWGILKTYSKYLMCRKGTLPEVWFLGLCGRIERNVIVYFGQGGVGGTHTAPLCILWPRVQKYPKIAQNTPFWPHFDPHFGGYP